MRVRFCLICVKTVTPLPFHWQPLFPLRAWAVTSLLGRGCAPEPWAKASVKVLMWGSVEERVELSLASMPGQPRGGRTRGAAPGALASSVHWRSPNQPADPCAWFTDGWERADLPSSNTWNLWCSLLTSDTNKTPWECGSLQSRTNSRRWGEAGISPRLQELCSSPLKARTMKTLC